MRKPAKNVQRPAHLKPRPPGLWLAERNDELLVEVARADILRLLSDPYYAEAYQRLLHELPLAAQLKRRPGRPVKYLATSVQGPMGKLKPKPDSGEEYDRRRKIRPPLSRLVLAISSAKQWTIPDTARFALIHLNARALAKWIGETNVDGKWIPKREKEARSMWRQVAKAARYERDRGSEQHNGKKEAAPVRRNNARPAKRGERRK